MQFTNDTSSKKKASVFLTQLPEISNIILQCGGEPTYNGVMILIFNDDFTPTYNQVRFNESVLGNILDSNEWC